MKSWLHLQKKLRAERRTIERSLFAACNWFIGITLFVNDALNLSQPAGSLSEPVKVGANQDEDFY